MSETPKQTKSRAKMTPEARREFRAEQGRRLALLRRRQKLQREVTNPQASTEKRAPMSLDELRAENARLAAEVSEWEKFR